MQANIRWPLKRNFIRRSSVANTFGLVRRNSDGSLRPHQGWDFEASIGTPCFAISDGKVEFISNAGDYGNVIVMSFAFEGRKLFAAYAHLSAMQTSVGQQVSMGQQIGSTGDSGNARGMVGRDLHLHFEIRTVMRPGRGLEGRLSPLKVFRTIPLDRSIETDVTLAASSAMTDEEILTRVLKYEGGFVDHRADLGGATNFGVTAATLGAWRKLGRPATSDEVETMTSAEAKAIYRQRYIADPGFEAVGDGKLRMIVVDCSVLYGPARAAKWLQMALGVFADGKVGNDTRTALASTNPGIVGRKILKLRIDRINARVVENPSQKVFFAGWMNRTNDLFQFA